MSKQEQVFIVAYLIELLYIVGFEECQMQTFRNGHIPKWTKISEPLFFFFEYAFELSKSTLHTFKLHI